ncbi:hypothetical protein FOVG_19077 [Fusarium oxysporum f. sp. pisi HDV247]|uniref:Uncharacterized protein n=1 Tax=Fusarium oxysporum f. sp. pisi HDV247 TaxID=1080344 RepID=W9N9L2_FUSOX|nr:hypothetical protein FOVG_19077 [Fusarium oxysporum f. sp. pisi HDV247]
MLPICGDRESAPGSWEVGLERAHGPNILVLTQAPERSEREGARAAKVGNGPITRGNWYSRLEKGMAPGIAPLM